MQSNTPFLILMTVLVSLGTTFDARSRDKQPVVSQPLQQTVYYGGDIITMEGDTPTYVEAVVERDGTIIYAGKRSGAVNNFAGKTVEVDLQGKTMMPGFIEPHAHPVSLGALILANDIVAPHEWRMPHRTYPAVRGKANYLEAVKNIIDSKRDRTRTVMIWGYHKAWHGQLTLH
ncbi:MAG TPA: hypothetical protein ENK19_11000, partial [Acidobacteria bacterium]|nr:hypothetical protein [Acidobacteriota bacterium]